MSKEGVPQEDELNIEGLQQELEEAEKNADAAMEEMRNSMSNLQEVAVKLETFNRALKRAVINLSKALVGK